MAKLRAVVFPVMLLLFGGSACSESCATHVLMKRMAATRHVIYVGTVTAIVPQPSGDAMVTLKVIETLREPVPSPINTFVLVAHSRRADDCRGTDRPTVKVGQTWLLSAFVVDGEMSHAAEESFLLPDSYPHRESALLRELRRELELMSKDGRRPMPMRRQ